jgi:3-O-methylgallate 3,4-dioxygenase
MAKIVLGMGTSHTPMLLASNETLPRFAETDRNIKHRDKEGRPVTYGELLEKADPKLAHLVAPANLVARQDKARDAARRLQEVLRGAKLDALVVMGDDQNESYKEDCRPAFAVYYGETIRNVPFNGFSGPDWARRATALYYEEKEPRDYPVDKRLALHLITSLVDREFDPVSSDALPEGKGEGHAFAFVRKRLMENQSLPVVPIFLNTYFPPNQPTPRRCYKLGQAIREAVESYPGDARVGIVGSGGLSHFVVDEELDRGLLEACARKDAEALQSLPRNKLNSGSSEIRMWICVAGAAEHLDVSWSSYVPGYRTPAGSGTGLGFALWS